ncbi:MAG: Bug family tripartite tricarboxylate transporter substrate binding protein [Burkholderiales bacterium]
MTTKSPLFALFVLLAAIVTFAAQAQTYPNRPVKLIVPFPPGGGADVLARVFAQELGRLWSQTLVVENRPGAGGMIGTEVVARATPDGYTLLHATQAANAVAPTLYAKVPYNAERDFVYVAPLGRQPSVLLAGTKVPAGNLKDLAEVVRANKGKISYAGPGIGLSGHLGMEMILQAVGMEVLHVPYKGSAPASQAVVAGETDLTLDLVSTGSVYVNAGKAKAIAVTGQARSPQLSGTPTFAELGYADLVIYTWQGIAVPAGTSKEIIAKLQSDLQAVKNSPELRERLPRMGIESFDLSPDEFGRFVQGESKRWGDVVRRIGIKVE